MNTAHWHLLLNHLPVIGIVIGTLILIAGFLFRNGIIKKTALGVFVFAALFAIPAYLTGEGAEETVEKMPGVTEAAIENHEDLGKLFLIVASTLGLLSLLTFVADLGKARMTRGMYILVLLVAIITGVFVKQLGTSGGEIRHTEIRTSNPQQNTEQQNAEPAEKTDGD